MENVLLLDGLRPPYGARGLLWGLSVLRCGTVLDASVKWPQSTVYARVAAIVISLGPPAPKETSPLFRVSVAIVPLRWSPSSGGIDDVLTDRDRIAKLNLMPLRPVNSEAASEDTMSQFQLGFSGN